MVREQLLLPSTYAPTIAYFAYLYLYEGKKVFLEAKEFFVKQGLRNRTQILSANGVQTLSIPVEGLSKTKTSMDQLMIADHNHWQKNHKQSIISAYANTPYFIYYWDDIELCYEQTDVSLFEFNLSLISRLASLINLDFKPNVTETYEPSYPLEVLDLRLSLDRQFSLEKLKSLEVYPYYQVFSSRYGFVPNLSIFDLIFNLGPESLLYLDHLSKSVILSNF